MAAPSIVQSVESTPGNTTAARQVTLTVTAGNLLVVFGTQFNGDVAYPASPISDTSGHTWTEHQDYLRASDYMGGGIWSAPVTSSGSTTITQSNTGMNSDAYYIVAVEVSGQATSFLDATGTGYSSWGSSLTIDLADTTYAEDIVFGMFLAVAGSNPWSPGSGWTGLQDTAAANPNSALIYRTTTSSGAYDPTATISGGAILLGVGISIKGSAGGGATSLVPRVSPIPSIIVR